MPSDAGKGQNFQTSDAKKGNSSNSGGKTFGDKTKFEPMLNCCQFLELPAEIRNRIYHFAEEGVYDDDDDLIRPLLLKRSKVASDSTTVPHLLSTLRYRALTQVCKQIRTEYRPMWLRQSRFCVELPTLAHFINAYYPKVADYQHAPKLLLISWDHGQLGDELEEGYGGDEESMEDVLTNITLLARLRAHCPTFTVNFASRQVLEDDVPNVECFECGHSIHCGCDMDCDHEDTWGEVLWQMRWSYGYLDALDAFLANTNENWLKMLRSTTNLQPRVEFTFHVYTQRLTIYIRFLKGQAPKGFKLKSMYNSALGFLNHWGMLDLKASDSIDYVIGEASGKFTRHDGECPSYVSTYNQIHLDSSTIAVWKKEKEAKTSAA
ncbi:uncharacterized protein J4E88_009267 [Alternaria novae-zelandiae]|nr:uncharacterized protein J4E88_009267 [Alternaria novae-zelandiae]XP_051329435.1 uncharacterized protein J4E85_002301 [Alternaria conjuncta]KAI4671234.1 hypothetical protein J4E88_009267 [Alternaria novae-zelandiae]KAI4934444.1 hypothetical protein J4E85_002301 [Alternaria conjuncta]